jgi:phosphatidate cytidylyltransferase
MTTAQAATGRYSFRSRYASLSAGRARSARSLASRHPGLTRKWRTWAIAAAVAAGCPWLGAPGATALAAALGVVAAIEYGKLSELAKADITALALAAVAFPVTAWLAPGDLRRAVGCALLAAVMIPVVSADVDGFARRATRVPLGMAWLCGLTGIVSLGAKALPVMTAVAVAGLSAWWCGRLLGGPPLSTAKRRAAGVSGAACGIAALIMAAVASGTPGVVTPPHVIAIAAGAPLSNLLGSMSRRGAEGKDSRKWQPGPGGLLHQLDSLLMAGVLAVIL